MIQIVVAFHVIIIKKSKVWISSHLLQLSHYSVVWIFFCLNYYDVPIKGWACLEINFRALERTVKNLVQCESHKSYTTVKERTKWLVVKLCYVVFTEFYTASDNYNRLFVHITTANNVWNVPLSNYTDRIFIQRYIGKSYTHTSLSTQRYHAVLYFFNEKIWKMLLLIRLKSCDNIRQLYDRYQYTIVSNETRLMKLCWI